MALGGAIYFKLDQANAEQALIKNCGVQLLCDPNGQYDPADDNVRKNRSFGLFVGLGVVGVVGIGTAIFGFTQSGRPAKPKQQSVFVLPYIGRGDGGVVVRGAF